MYTTLYTIHPPTISGLRPSRSLSIPLRLTHAAIRLTGKPTVLVVSSGAPSSLPHLSLGAQAKVSVTTAWETVGAVFASHSVAAVVVNVDTQSIALVRSIHILYPNVQIVAEIGRAHV